MNEALYTLQKYMITYDMLDGSDYDKYNKLKLSEKNDLILIHEKNIFFWIFFITKYSYESYLDLERKKYTMQEKEKYSNVEQFNQSSSIFKVHKLKKINVINNLLYEDTNFHTLKALCISNNLSIVIVFNHCYSELIFGDTPSYIFVNEGNNSFYMKEYSKEELEKEKKDKIFIKDLEKKMNSVSFYKVDELKDMAKKLKIDIVDSNNKKKKKVVLYDEIKLKLNKL